MLWVSWSFGKTFTLNLAKKISLSLFQFVIKNVRPLLGKKKKEQNGFNL